MKLGLVHWVFLLHFETLVSNIIFTSCFLYSRYKVSSMLRFLVKKKISKYNLLLCDELTVQWPEANSLVILIRLVLRVASSLVSSVRQVHISYVSSHRWIQIHRCEMLYLEMFILSRVLIIIYMSKCKVWTRAARYIVSASISRCAHPQ